MDLSAGQSGLMTGRRLEKAWSLGRGIEVPGCMVLIMLYMNMIEYDCSRIIYLEGFSPTSHSSFYCFCVGCENNPKLTPIATSHNRKSRHLRVDVSGLRSKGAKSRWTQRWGLQLDRCPWLSIFWGEGLAGEHLPIFISLMSGTKVWGIRNLKWFTSGTVVPEILPVWLWVWGWGCWGGEYLGIQDEIRHERIHESRLRWITIY